jgi:peptide deformylase
MILPIVAYGDTVLRRDCEDIDIKAYPGLDILIENMFETMYNACGIGLAAPQVGKGIRLFVTDASAIDADKYPDFKKVFINPEILEEYGDEWGYEEGCLSIPGIRGEVIRHSKLRIKYYDASGKQYIEEYDGMPARIIQHEYDHIEGVLFVDHFSSLKKRMLKGKLTNISKGITDADYRMRFVGGR